MNRHTTVNSMGRLFTFLLVVISLLFSSLGINGVSSANAQENIDGTPTPSATLEPQQTSPLKGASAHAKPIPSQIVIRFKPTASEQEKVDYVRSFNGSIKKRIVHLNAFIVRLPKDAAALPVPDSSIVEGVEQDYYIDALDFTPNDPRYAEQWALPAIGASSAWAELPVDAPNVTVAVIDSGICASHPDLGGRILDGWDFLENDAVPQDDFGHGCSVSGVIAAVMDNGIGIAGVAPNARIMPLRVLNASGVGSYSDVADAIVYATDHGAQVINLSLGGSNPSSTLESAVNYAISKGVIIVAAAGNNGTEGALYPAAYPDVIAVGSVDSNLQYSSFSNYGSQIDIWAPGRDILTTKRDGTYGLVSGTSFAAPYVAGAGAILMRSLSLQGQVLTIPSINSRIPTATSAVIETISPTPIISPSGTSEWNTIYTNITYGFSLDIPLPWKVKEWDENPIDTFSLSLIDDVFLNEQISNVEHEPLALAVRKKDNELDLQTWFSLVSTADQFPGSSQPQLDFFQVGELHWNGIKNLSFLEVRAGQVYSTFMIDTGPYVIVIWLPYINTIEIQNLQIEILTSLNIQGVGGEIFYASTIRTMQDLGASYLSLQSPPENYAQNTTPDYYLPWTKGEPHVVTQGWGPDPCPNCISHNTQPDYYAYDFGIVEGTPIRASRSGTITSSKSTVDPNTCGGRSLANTANYVTISHYDGSSTTYWHLRSVAKTSGGIAQGQLIGYSGKTGYTECAPHLHFKRQEQGGAYTNSLPIYFEEYPDQTFIWVEPSGTALTSQNRAVIVCQDADFGGSCERFVSFDEDLLNNIVGNDSITSIFVPSSWGVRFWQHNYAQGRGACLGFPPVNGDTPIVNLASMLVWEYCNFGSSFNPVIGNRADNQISSIEIYTNDLLCGQDVIGGQCYLPPTPPPGNQAPNAPSLTSPESGSSFSSSPQLCWQNNGDPDGDSLLFVVSYWGTSSGSTWTSSTCWTPPSLPVGNYSWTVKARDPGGLETSANSTRTFNIVSSVVNGIELCDGMNYGSPCSTPFTYTSDSTCINLASSNWSARAESLRFKGSYVGNYSVILYDDSTNSCSRYQARYDGNATTLGAFNNKITSIRIEKHRPPQPKPSANFDASPLNGVAPKAITLQILDMSYVSTCLWNYGDGQTSTTCAQTHDHTYTSAGTYNVSLTVYGSDGQSDTQTRYNYINITTPQPAVCPSTINGWQGEYWNNMDLSGPTALCRDDPDPLDLWWAYDPPDPSISSDHFSARWTRTQYFAAGTYRFYLRHDDGAKLYVDGILKLDLWGTWGDTGEVSVLLSTGDHTIRVDYYENDGAANVKLWWAHVGPGDFAKIYPSDSFTLESDQVTLSWNPSSTATGYEYCVDTTNDDSCDGGAWVATSSTSVATSGYTPGTDYFWQVRARNANGRTYADDSTWWWFHTAKVMLLEVYTTDELGPASIGGSSHKTEDDVQSNDYKSIFYPGDKIGLWMWIYQEFSTGPMVYAEWHVMDPAGNYVPELGSVYYDYIDPYPTVDLGITGTIPTNAVHGEYTLVGELLFGGEWQIQTTTFTVAGSPAVEAWDVFVTDAEGYASSLGEIPQRSAVSDVGSQSSLNFNAGDGIYLYIVTYNDVVEGESAFFEWRVTDKWGRDVPDLEWSGELSSSLGESWWYLPATIPSNAITGDYKFTGYITYGDRTTYQSDTFYVYGPAAPSNNGFGAPIVITGVPYANSQDTWGANTATSDPIPSCGYGKNSNSVWYKYTAPANGLLEVDTWGSDYDTVLAVWTGTLNNLTEIQCVDDAYGYLEAWLEEVPVTAGTIYYIEVMDYGNPGGGNLEIAVNFAQTSGNDGFNTPVPITANPYTRIQNTGGATQAYDDPELTNCNRLPGQASVWYKYTPSLSGQLDLDTIGSDYDTMLAVWTGTRGNLTPIGCNDDIGEVAGDWITNSSLSVALISGTTYYIEISTYAGMIDINGASATELQKVPGIASQNGSAQSLQDLKTAVEKGEIPVAASQGDRTDEISAQFWGGQMQLNTVYHPLPGSFNKSSPGNISTNVSLNPTLTWSSSADANSYEYCYDTTNDNDCTSWTDSGTSTSVTLTGLSLGTTYYWHVRAINSIGARYSNNNVWWSFTTGNVPAAFIKSLPINGLTNEFTNPTLNWFASTGATSYVFCYDVTNDNTCDNSWVNNGTSTSAGVILSAATPYYWQVKAINSFGETESDGGSWWTFTTGNITLQKVTLASVSVNDGWVLESSESSAQGGTLNSTATTFNLGDEAGDKQYRSVLSFDTAGLPDNAVITKVTLKIRKMGLVGTNPFTILSRLRVDIRKPYFGASAGLVASDFQAAANRVAAGLFDTTPVNNWYSAVINSLGYPYVNLTGTTQFRLYFTKDDNDDGGADYMRFFSGNYATASARPTLIIEYYVP